MTNNDKSDISVNRRKDLTLILDKAKRFVEEVRYGDLTFKRQDGRIVSSEMTEKEKH